MHEEVSVTEEYPVTSHSFFLGFSMEMCMGAFELSL